MNWRAGQERRSAAGFAPFPDAICMRDPWMLYVLAQIESGRFERASIAVSGPNSLQVDSPENSLGGLNDGWTCPVPFFSIVRRIDRFLYRCPNRLVDARPRFIAGIFRGGEGECTKFERGIGQQPAREKQVLYFGRAAGTVVGLGTLPEVKA